jgi:hypothetical protein
MSVQRGVAQPIGGDFESRKVDILFVNHQTLLQRWSDHYSFGMGYRLGVGGFSDKNIAYLISVPTKIRYAYPIEKSGWSLLTEGGLSVQVLHLVTDASTDNDKNQTDFRWKSSLDAVISAAFLRIDGDLDYTLGFEYSTKLIGAKNWRNFNGKDIATIKAPTGLAAVYFAIGHKFD